MNINRKIYLILICYFILFLSITAEAGEKKSKKKRGTHTHQTKHAKKIKSSQKEYKSSNKTEKYTKNPNFSLEKGSTELTSPYGIVVAPNDAAENRNENRPTLDLLMQDTVNSLYQNIETTSQEERNENVSRSESKLAGKDEKLSDILVGNVEPTVKDYSNTINSNHEDIEKKQFSPISTRDNTVKEGPKSRNEEIESLITKDNEMEFDNEPSTNENLNIDNIQDILSKTREFPSLNAEDSNEPSEFVMDNIEPAGIDYNTSIMNYHNGDEEKNSLTISTKGNSIDLENIGNAYSVNEGSVNRNDNNEFLKNNSEKEFEDELSSNKNQKNEDRQTISNEPNEIPSSKTDEFNNLSEIVIKNTKPTSIDYFNSINDNDLNAQNGQPPAISIDKSPNDFLYSANERSKYTSENNEFLKNANEIELKNNFTSNEGRNIDSIEIVLNDNNSQEIAGSAYESPSFTNGKQTEYLLNDNIKTSNGNNLDDQNETSKKTSKDEDRSDVKAKIFNHLENGEQLPYLPEAKFESMDDENLKFLLNEGLNHNDEINGELMKNNEDVGSSVNERNDVFKNEENTENNIEIHRYTQSVSRENEGNPFPSYDKMSDQLKSSQNTVLEDQHNISDFESYAKNPTGIIIDSSKEKNSMYTSRDLSTEKLIDIHPRLDCEISGCPTENIDYSIEIKEKGLSQELSVSSPIFHSELHAPFSMEKSSFIGSIETKFPDNPMADTVDKSRYSGEAFEHSDKKNLTGNQAEDLEIPENTDIDEFSTETTPNSDTLLSSIKDDLYPSLEKIEYDNMNISKEDIGESQLIPSNDTNIPDSSLEENGDSSKINSTSIDNVNQLGSPLNEDDLSVNLQFAKPLIDKNESDPDSSSSEEHTDGYYELHHEASQETESLNNTLEEEYEHFPPYSDSFFNKNHTEGSKVLLLNVSDSILNGPKESVGGTNLSNISTLIIENPLIIFAQLYFNVVSPTIPDENEDETKDKMTKDILPNLMGNIFKLVTVAQNVILKKSLSRRDNMIQMKTFFKQKAHDEIRLRKDILQFKLKCYDTTPFMRYFNNDLYKRLDNGIGQCFKVGSYLGNCEDDMTDNFAKTKEGFRQLIFDVYMCFVTDTFCTGEEIFKNISVLKQLVINVAKYVIYENDLLAYEKQDTKSCFDMVVFKFKHAFGWY